METNKYVAMGSDKNHVTWIEYNGKRICTMRQGENDWTYCKLIEKALNNHDKLIEFVKEMSKRYENSEWIGGHAKELLKSIEQDT